MGVGNHFFFGQVNCYCFYISYSLLVTFSVAQTRNTLLWNILSFHKKVLVRGFYNLTHNCFSTFCISELTVLKLTWQICVSVILTQAKYAYSWAFLIFFTVMSFWLQTDGHLLVPLPSCTHLTSHACTPWQYSLAYYLGRQKFRSFM